MSRSTTARMLGTVLPKLLKVGAPVGRWDLEINFCLFFICERQELKLKKSCLPPVDSDIDKYELGAIVELPVLVCQFRLGRGWRWSVRVYWVWGW